MTAVTGPSQTALRKQNGPSFCVLGMKKLFFVLTLLVGALPSTALADPSVELAGEQRPKPPTVWLVLRYGAGGPGALEKIEMRDMAQCEMQGVVWESSKRISESGYTGFECLEGK